MILRIAFTIIVLLLPAMLPAMTGTQETVAQETVAQETAAPEEIAASEATPVDQVTAVLPPGFTSIFNGKDLSGWYGMPHFDHRKLKAMPEAERKAKLEKWNADAKAHWTVENGELVNDGHGAYLVTNKQYSDYEFVVEYKTVEKADSGIYLKWTPQVQIWDTTDNEKFKHGANLGSGGL